jgi:TRAP transporter TAXI family solute receptor
MKQRSLAVCLCIALVFGMSGLAAAKTEFISIGTGGTGGVYYPLGGGIAEVWSKHVPGVQAVAEVTGASVENVKLAHKGETVVGMVMGDVAVAGFEGSGKFEGKKNDVLAMAMLYPNLLQMVVLKSSGITDVMQLKGKKISTGSPGSGTNFMTEAVLKALGFTAADYTDSRLSFTENANALRDGTIDMGSWSVGPGTSSILDLATTHEIRVLSFTPEQTEKILAANSEYAAVDLTGGIYRGVDQPVPTIGVWNVLICQSTLDTELVYNLAKALFENREYLLKIHPSADYTTPENTVAYAPIPLHPGTIKYLTEKGIEVPDKLKP